MQAMRTPTRLPPLAGSNGFPGVSHARNHLAASQYFDEHNIRGHFTALTQMLMIHQPNDALRFMQSELGKMIEDQDRAHKVDYAEAIGAGGGCLLRVQAEYEGPDGKRKRTYTRLLPAAEPLMRHRAEREAVNTLHAVFWNSNEDQTLPVEPESPRGSHEARLSAIFELERELALERRLLESHSDQVTLTPRRLVLNSPRQGFLGQPSAPALSGYEMGVLMCTYAAQGWRQQLEDLLDNGVDVDMGDYDKRTALHLASSEGHVDVVECLLGRGASVNVTDRMGFSPLVDACRHGHFRIQTMLREAGGQLVGMDISVGVSDDMYAAAKDKGKSKPMVPMEAVRGVFVPTGASVQACAPVVQDMMIPGVRTFAAATPRFLSVPRIGFGSGTPCFMGAGPIFGTTPRRFK